MTISSRPISQEVKFGGAESSGGGGVELGLLNTVYLLSVGSDFRMFKMHYKDEFLLCDLSGIDN